MIEALQKHTRALVIWSHQNAPRPQPPYVVVEPMTVEHLLNDYCPQAQAVASVDRYNYRVHYVGRDALRELVKLVLACRAGSSPVTWYGNPQFTPDLLANSEWGERATVECSIPAVTTLDVSESWGTIDTIRAKPAGDVLNPPTIIEVTRGNS